MQDKNTTKGIFSRVLRALMEKHGVTQDELSKKIKVSQTTVWKWRNGAIPDGISIVNLAAFFGIKESDFFRDQSQIITEVIEPSRSIKKVKISELEKAIAEMRSGLDRMSVAVESLKKD